MTKRIKVGVVGCGAIGKEIALFIERKLGDYFLLTGICDLMSSKATGLLKKLKKPSKILELDDLINKCDLIIEAASISCAQYIIKKAAEKKKIIIILSVGVFVKYPKTLDLISSNTKILIPSGAISGVDGVGSLSFGKIKSLKLITSKPPSSLKGVSYLEKKGVDVLKVKKERTVFKGSIKEAIRNFPKNVNVAATLFLSARFKGIKVIIKVNPHIKRNIHCIEADSSEGRLRLQIENAPSKMNPKTSVMAILSTKRLLNKLVNNFNVGS